VDGGRIICEGSPEEIIHHLTSLTALHLKPMLKSV